MRISKLGRFRILFLRLVLLSLGLPLGAQDTSDAFDVKAHYEKREYQLSMRDGAKLFTSCLHASGYDARLSDPAAAYSLRVAPTARTRTATNSYLLYSLPNRATSSSSRTCEAAIGPRATSFT